MHDYNIPPLVKTAIDNYVENRWEPGSFTTAVLENNLKEAIGRADVHSMAALKDIVMYCYWEIPGQCWGSPEKVDAWLSPREAATDDPSSS